jgi:hypothetical protein
MVGVQMDGGTFRAKYGISRTTGNRLVQCGAPALLFTILAYIHTISGCIVRDLDCLELFAGAGELHKQFNSAGLKGVGIELHAGPGPEHDLTTPIGIVRAIQLVLRLKIAGLLWNGMPCSTFIFLNRGTSKRSRQCPLGSEQVPSVATANLLASRVAILIMLAAARSAVWITEQPASSVLEHHPRLAQIRALCLEPNMC